jgi:hypothetical protein
LHEYPPLTEYRSVTSNPTEELPSSKDAVRRGNETRGRQEYPAVRQMLSDLVGEPSSPGGGDSNRVSVTVCPCSVPVIV